MRGFFFGSDVVGGDMRSVACCRERVVPGECRSFWLS